ncbi:MAG: MBL fold metallo-hydrolase [Candidatus Promineifilaceae bacterium]|nr:MBL fold metallo-hydrolase [Candidatus Promineifilaceae bacterium]
MSITFPFAQGQATVLNVGHLQARLSDWLPLSPSELQQPALRAYQANYDRLLHLPLQVLVVQLPDITILADPMRYADLLGTEFAISGYEPPPALDEQLASIGVAPTTVEHVIISHAHFDHFGAVLDPAGGLQFPNARHYLGAADWEAAAIQRALRDPTSLAATTLGRLRAGGLLELVRVDQRLAPGIELWLTPGESDGHLVLRLADGEETLFYLGDLIHHPLEAARPDIVPPWSEPQLVQSRQRVFAAATASRARLIATHIAGIGQLAQTETGYRWFSAKPSVETSAIDPRAT